MRLIKDLYGFTSLLPVDDEIWRSTLTEVDCEPQLQVSTMFEHQFWDSDLIYFLQIKSGDGFQIR